MSRYSLKNIFLGIGIGLIIASAVNLNTPKPELSVQDIRNEAEKHGMVVLDQKEVVNKQQQSGQSTTTAPATPEPANTTTTQTIDITIKPGDTSEAIGIILEASGLVADRNDFIKRVYATRSGHNMQTGKFTITKGASVDEIIKILTTKRNTPR